MSGKNNTMKGGDETSLNKQAIMNVLQRLQISIRDSSDFEQKKQKIRSFQKFLETYKTNPFLQENDIQNLISNISNNAQESNYNKVQRLIGMNSEQKNANYERILKKLNETYKNKKEYNKARLTRLARIGSSIESINRIQYNNNKKIILGALKNTIKEKENSLKIYPEFQQYKAKIYANST